MDKKKIIPVVLGGLLLTAIVWSVVTPSNKVSLEVISNPTEFSTNVPDSVALKVYVENSGSMDGYMCVGSQLKDAVFDYISEAKNMVRTCELYYINSDVIAYDGTLDAYIKDLNPLSFARAGGNRANTDLRQIFKAVLDAHKRNTISILVSDCILDIPEDARSFFGNCQVSIKNTFNEALVKMPTLGVQVAQLESKFDGTWFCGNNSERLSGVKRPYYIWVIGDVRLLAKLNREAPLRNVIHGIKNYCAYAPVKKLPFDAVQKSFVVNHSDVINVSLLVDLSTTLQDCDVAGNVGQYHSIHPEHVKVVSCTLVTEQGSKYSHVVNLEINSPRTLHDERLTFNYPYLAPWVTTSNDDTGQNIKGNMAKTTGILYLVTGVAEAYKGYTSCGNFEFILRNK